jgi:hypothetical protein
MPGRIGGVAAPYYSTYVPIPTMTTEVRRGLPERLLTTVGLGQIARAKRETVRGNVESWEIRQGESVWGVELSAVSGRGEPVHVGSRQLGASGAPVALHGKSAE